MSKAAPKIPLREVVATKSGGVEVVRLIYVDVLRAYMQDPTVSDIEPEDTGYPTIREYSEMREYVRKRCPWITRVDYNEKTQECWISIPSTIQQPYRTNLTIWKTILRRWPAFLDPELKRK